MWTSLAWKAVAYEGVAELAFVVTWRWRARLRDGIDGPRGNSMALGRDGKGNGSLEIGIVADCLKG